SWMAVTCCVMGKALGLPVFVKMTGNTELVGGALDPNGNWLASIKRKGLSLATGYQVISSEIERAISLVGLPPEKTLRIANAVDLDTFGLRYRDGPGVRKGAKTAKSKAKPIDPSQPALGQTGMVELDAISPAFLDSNLLSGVPSSIAATTAPGDQTPIFAPSGRRITALRQELCPGSEFVVLYSGRLEPIKRIDLLLRAWRDALAHDKGAWLVLVGGGSLLTELQSQATRYGIDDRVLFVGHVTRIADYIHAADILALVSDSEGLSNAMLEGMSGGLPVLGSRISGTEDFVTDNETGWLFPPGDLSALTRQLAAARATPARRLVKMSRAAHDEIVERASVQAVTRALLDVYAQQGSRADT
ncbi:MAG: glycosyltransferase family 4 protein, partial [Burkholderiaceae bacterium]